MRMKINVRKHIQLGFIELISFSNSQAFIQLHQSCSVHHSCCLSQPEASQFPSSVYVHCSHCVCSQHFQILPILSSIHVIKYATLRQILWLPLLERSVAMVLIHCHSSSTLGFFTVFGGVRTRCPAKSCLEYNCFEKAYLLKLLFAKSSLWDIEWFYLFRCVVCTPVLQTSLGCFRLLYQNISWNFGLVIWHQSVSMRMKSWCARKSRIKLCDRILYWTYWWSVYTVTNIITRWVCYVSPSGSGDSCWFTKWDWKYIHTLFCPLVCVGNISQKIDLVC
jgi:hypothetical protein